MSKIKSKPQNKSLLVIRTQKSNQVLSEFLDELIQSVQSNNTPTSYKGVVKYHI